MEDGVLGDLVEDDAARAAAVEAERLDEVPGDGLSLAVLIGSQPDELRLVGGFLELGDHFLLVGRHHILGREAVRHVDAELLVLQVPDVSETGLDREFLPQIFLNGLRLGRRFHDD